MACKAIGRDVGIAPTSLLSLSNKTVGATKEPVESLRDLVFACLATRNAIATNVCDAVN